MAAISRIIVTSNERPDPRRWSELHAQSRKHSNFSTVLMIRARFACETLSEARRALGSRFLDRVIGLIAAGVTTLLNSAAFAFGAAAPDAIVNVVVKRVVETFATHGAVVADLLCVFGAETVGREEFAGIETTTVGERHPCGTLAGVTHRSLVSVVRGVSDRMLIHHADLMRSTSTNGLARPSWTPVLA